MLHSNHGPGRLNKYYDINRVPSLVQYNGVKGTKERNGRALFENHSNPYQFDTTFVNRLDLAKQHVMEKMEETMVRIGRSRLEHGHNSPTTANTESSPISQRPGSEYSENSRGHQRIRVGERQSAVRYQGSVMGSALGLNSVQAVPNSMPGYSGFIPALLSENVHEVPFAKASVVSAQTRSCGREYNGVVGQMRLPSSWDGMGCPSPSSSRSFGARN